MRRCVMMVVFGERMSEDVAIENFPLLRLAVSPLAVFSTTSTNCEFKDITHQLESDGCSEVLRLS
jgi:hypothetical protein